MSIPDCVTKAELGTKLKLHRNTVTRLLATGRFPNAFRTGTRWRIPMADVEAYIWSQRKPTVVLALARAPALANAEIHPKLPLPGAGAMHSRGVGR